MVGLVMHIHRRRPSDPTERSGDGRGGRDPGTFPFWVDSEGFEDPGRVEVGDESGCEGGVGASATRGEERDGLARRREGGRLKREERKRDETNPLTGSQTSEMSYQFLPSFWKGPMVKEVQLRRRQRKRNGSGSPSFEQDESRRVNVDSTHKSTAAPQPMRSKLQSNDISVDRKWMNGRWINSPIPTLPLEVLQTSGQGLPELDTSRYRLDHTRSSSSRALLIDVALVHRVGVGPS